MSINCSADDTTFHVYGKSTLKLIFKLNENSENMSKLSGARDNKWSSPSSKQK